MKKLLLSAAFLSVALGYSQTQPTVYNPGFELGPKSGSTSLCSCSGWVNTDIADQGEGTNTGGLQVLKLDNLESDGAYQEIAVEANSDYTLDMQIRSRNVNAAPTFEIYVLKGSGYEAGYTPAYVSNTTPAPNSGYGYTTIADVENSANHVSFTSLGDPGGTFTAISTISFSTGSETSIAIFLRSIGPYVPANHGDTSKDKGWMSADGEILVEDLALVNTGPTLSNNDITLDGKEVKVFQDANGNLNIGGDVEVNTTKLYNISGQEVAIGDNRLDVSTLSPGVYIAAMESSNGDTAAKKVVITDK